MTFWNDRSEIVSVYRQLNDETAVVAYIMIDNLDELMQYVQEQYRTVVGQVESVLKEWAESVGGIFKEYERERYIFIFEAAHVREFIENKFDILDRVRNCLLYTSCGSFLKIFSRKSVTKFFESHNMLSGSKNGKGLCFRH